ncbi:efflux RND transporter periplasmic adaptor subunit [Caldimonas brevitalea]|nr:efflux RND transporter periplasmic adaptor subunit [Caldimonas brevitalea]
MTIFFRRGPCAAPHGVPSLRRLLLAMFAAGLPFAAAGADATPPAACRIEADRIVELAAPQGSVVERITVDRGDGVAAGQALAVLRAERLRAPAAPTVSARQLDEELRAARSEAEQAGQTLKRLRHLASQDFIGAEALAQARADHEAAQRQVGRALARRAAWQHERDAAAAELRQRTVSSPVKGVVVERYVQPGERVTERPLLRLAVLDPLRVELVLPASRYREVAAGDKVMVYPELPGAAPVTADVAGIDRVMDPASNTFRVRLTLPNPGQKVPAGLLCKVTLPREVPPATAPAALPKVRPVVPPVYKRAFASAAIN